MAKNIRKRKAKRSLERLETSTQSTVSSSGIITKKKRVSWAQQLEAFQAEEFLNDLNDTNASIALATELLTSTPQKSALAAKHGKQRLQVVSVEKSDASIKKKQKTNISFDLESPLKSNDTENTPPKDVTDTSSLKTAVKKKASLGDKPTTSGQKLKKIKKTKNGVQSVEPILNEVNGPTAELNQNGDNDKKSTVEQKPVQNGATDGKKKRVRKNKPDPKRSLFVGNIPYEATPVVLTKLFQEQIGEVERLHIQKDKRTKLPRGSGFVTFATLDANEALTKLTSFIVQGRELRFKNIIKNKKNRQVASAVAKRPVVGQHLSGVRKGNPEQDLRQRLSNYIISKKTFNSAVSKPKLSKEAIKAMRKRKNGKARKKTLL